VSTTAGVRFRGEGIQCEFSQASRGSLPSRSSRAAATVLRCCSVGRGRTRAWVATSSAWTARQSTSSRVSPVPTRRRAPRPGRGAGRARSATTGSTTTATASSTSTATASRAPSSPARTARRGSAASGGAASGRTAAWAPERPDGGAHARTRSDRPPRSVTDSTTTATAASTSRSVATTTSAVPGRGIRADRKHQRGEAEGRREGRATQVDWGGHWTGAHWERRGTAAVKRWSEPPCVHREVPVRTADISCERRGCGAPTPPLAWSGVCCSAVGEG